MATDTTRSIDVAASTDLVGWTPLQIMVVAICTVINMLDGMDVLIISYVAPAMATDWGVSFEALGVIFSAGLVGMMLGCVLIAPLADGIGRRPVVLGALVLITIGALGTGLVGTIPAFVGFRLVTGLGIGTLLASIAALASEYAPAGKRSIAIGAFQAGYPIGAVFTGLAAIWAIPHYGWQATLLGAGVVSAAILPIAFFLLPESIDFLQNRQPAGALAKINTLRARLGLARLDSLPPPRTRSAAPKLGHLFADGLWKSTVTLWFSTFAGFMVLYFVTSWIPKLATEAGLSAGDSLWAGSIFNVGGFIGAATIGWLATKRDIGWLIRTYMLVGCVLMMIFSMPMPLALVLIVAVGMGVTVQGGFTGFYSLAAQMYPSEVRSSGIGWAIGIGRGGSVIGPILGGFLLGKDLPLWIVFLCFAIPLAISGVLASLVRHRADLA
ncbi:MFS transporter [Sphingomonas crocodyli]|uniref:MFS transporter n=1 Tax=Sphingomonas crocodyli TaxID=1979270 RepID=A0A437M6X9_9SPHN|nr:MFS transporter [Sphingomonas crocodyli]RVT93316.1 MFS transporter [Sphingomonas crocodyli]